MSISVERARSGRARCRTCNSYIAHGELRFAVSGEAGMYDEYGYTHFHHLACYGSHISRRQYPSLAALPGVSALTAAEKALVERCR